MGRRFDEIALRKNILIERCARERDELAATFHQIRLPFNLGAMVLKAGKSLQAYPVAAGLSGLLVTGYAVKLMRAVGKLFKMVRIVRPVWSWWKRRRAK